MDLGVQLTRDYGSNMGHLLSAVFVLGSMIFVWRSFYGMRIDDRYDMYPLDVSRDYVVLNRGGARWQEVLDGRGVEYLLWPSTSPLASRVRNG